ncbi:MAG TPA: hypothetical protein EYP09_00175, partial [Anaerolineae bacterium]|nr:hypothetical protein [Anaerolineae bacterium]
SRLATALLRAVGIPARPVSPYNAQFWVQSPSGEGTWVAMGTSGGRSAYRERGNTQAEYGTLSPGAVRYFPVDEGPVIHSDWYTENKCMWREAHPWSEHYEGTPAGYQQAVADLEKFAQTGEAPQGQLVPPSSELHYEIAYSDFTLHLSNIGDQQVLVARFPIIMASSYVTPTGDVAYWTNHPEWVTRTWIEKKTNPPVEGEERWFCIEFDLSELQPTLTLLLPHDVDRLPNGHTLITDGGQRPGGATSAQPGSGSKIIEVDTDGNVVWAFDQGLNWAHNADRLPNGNTIISDTGHDRVIEIDSVGTIIWNSDDVTLSDGSALNYPNDANWLPDDHLLITDRDNHRVIEIARDGTIVWQFGETGVPGSDDSHLNSPHNADRLPNGNTIIADSNNNRIIEVAPDGIIVWQYP